MLTNVNAVLVRLVRSLPMQMVLTIVFYFFYAAAFGLCVVPSLHVVALGWRRFEPFVANSALNYLQFGVYLGVALFAYYVTSVFVVGIGMRVSSLGIRPGRYPAKSFTVMRWMIHNGFYGMAKTMFLPMIRATGFANLFFRIAGAKIGRRVRINTGSLVDCYLLEVGDNVILGGDALITCHIVENYHLILERVVIGENTLIGARSYITPGVEIGANSVIGIGSYLRKGTRLPPKSMMTSLAAVPLRQAREIERGLDRFYLKRGAGPNHPPATDSSG
ncbi:DapH/DapD/GlmU-related protein [Spirochaeta africana]|uniref:Acetyltransferase (Isoleucine patch superfamily) n=1 Tax=Spirochaeta africana (strain ATCC 700263 / DSM 8902 / Z-7692) TaxID=889378 RepID=H9UGS3_SPIAZ|nr:DapH/DapD/GlmU-related protein [Spirochaeta africana]AFG36716.1 hypothetical protein Spiaf_0616 [Spirochaeta africana DSM 8902]